mgnify:CR=1 FL=1
MAGVKIGRVNGQFVVNPDLETMDKSELHLVVAGTADAVMMVEAGANELSEATMLQALELAHAEIKKIVAKIDELLAQFRFPGDGLSDFADFCDNGGRRPGRSDEPRDGLDVETRMAAFLKRRHIG